MPPFLIIQRGPVIGHRHDLDTGECTIGRGQDNDLVLNDVMVSRYHAVIRQENAGVVVIDLGSANPVLVNNVPLEPGVPQRLQPRDVVVIGAVVLSFQDRAPSPVRPPSSQPEGEPRTLVGSSLARAAEPAVAPLVPERWAEPAPPTAARSAALPPPVLPEPSPAPPAGRRAEPHTADDTPTARR
jgi:pSer/pThr/pTyr-binding forkhead associated (FHA) protein